MLIAFIVVYRDESSLTRRTVNV